MKERKVMQELWRSRTELEHIDEAPEPHDVAADRRRDRLCPGRQLAELGDEPACARVETARRPRWLDAYARGEERLDDRLVLEPLEQDLVGVTPRHQRVESSSTPRVARRGRPAYCGG